MVFKKILIANRGEIAVRIIRTCREMGIGTVAVYSDADEAALHVLEADESVFLGPAEPCSSYLDMKQIIRAAEEAGAQAIHPGYGFLAENPDFATLVEASGLVLIGPPARVIRDLGDKTKARTIMQSAGVPVIPGMLEATRDLNILRDEADRMGFPVLVKASAGGGGKGMRVVGRAQDMEEACMSAMGEARKAFGNDALYLEKHLERARHVEFQILADRQGHVVHLFERECSIQRRHQKIIEETPSTALTPELRRAMAKAAVSAASASGYVNAGTVEFLLEPSGQFFFLEVNTRLQVEHPITEMTTALDLVRHQLEIAAGLPLSFDQRDIVQRGHAIECRIYAEDPEKHFFPSPGPILLYREPQGPGIRVDAGIYQEFQVPVEYDPILSKLIVWSEDRRGAVQRMLRALRNYAVLGVRTTIPFLLDVIASAAFEDGATYTDMIETHFPDWSPDHEEASLARIAYVIDELTRPGHASVPQKPNDPATPWETLGDWTL